MYRLQQDVEKVGTGELAQYMCVSAGTATTMIKRLHELGYAKHEPYHGLILSETGTELAERLVRAHRILEVFLVKTLGMTWDQVHEIACRLEHHFSDENIELIWEKMGRPACCPHGNPIDMKAVSQCSRLESAPVGVDLKVARISDERAEFLLHLQGIGIQPGLPLRIMDKGTVDSVFHLEFLGSRTTIGPEVARHVWTEQA